MVMPTMQWLLPVATDEAPHAWQQATAGRYRRGTTRLATSYCQSLKTSHHTPGNKLLPVATDEPPYAWQQATAGR